MHRARSSSPKLVAENTNTTWTALTRDQADNPSECSEARDYTHDGTPPWFEGVQSATPISTTEIELTWEPASDAVSAAQDLIYEVCASSTPCSLGACQPFTADLVTGPGAEGTIVSDLEPNERYCFVVRSRDEAGNRDLNHVRVSARTPGPNVVVDFALGHGHTCAVIADGTAWCWGQNKFGKLGDDIYYDGIDETAAHPEPLQIEQISSARDLAATSTTNCAVHGLGEVSCWGGRGPRKGSRVPPTARRPSRWRLRRLSVTEPPGAAPVLRAPCSRQARPLGGLEPRIAGRGPFPGSRPVLRTASYGGHTCALRADGQLLCWGGNYAGQVGTGAAVGDWSPATLVTGLTGQAGIIDLVGDERFFCALASDGEVLCWGRDGDGKGQLGAGPDGPHAVLPVPVPVEGLPPAREIFVAEGHACAVLGDGSVRCWGMGSGNCWTAIGDPEGSQAPPGIPVEAPGVTEVRAGGSLASSGDAAACVQRASGEVMCWGPLLQSLAPELACHVPAEIPVAHGVQDVSNGSAMLTADGTVKWLETLDAWSAGDPGVDMVLAMADGGTVMLRADGTVWRSAWSGGGLNVLGPMQLTAFEDIVELVHGANGGTLTRLFGVAADGRVIGWGQNEPCFSLGDPVISQTYKDLDGDFVADGGVEVSGIEDAIAVAAGREGGCALHVDRSVSCWGLVVAPDGSDVATWEPVPIPELP